MFQDFSMYSFSLNINHHSMRDKTAKGLLQAKIEVQQYTLISMREEIDDHINQLLSSIKMILGITGRNVLPIYDTLETAQETLTTAIRDLRSLSKSLNIQSIEQINL